MSKSIAEMKKELEAEGYKYLYHEPITHHWIAPDKITAFLSGVWSQPPTDNMRDSTEAAYRHLQEQRELAALREFVLEINLNDALGHVFDSYIADGAYGLAKQFNIKGTKSP